MLIMVMNFNNHSIMCWIYSSLVENVMSKIIGLTTTSEIWNVLQIFFSTVKSQNYATTSSTSDYEQRWFEYDALSSQVKYATDNLVAIGESISEQDHVLCLVV